MKSEAHIYKVPILVGRMSLSMTAVVIASDEAAARKMVLDPRSFGTVRLDDRVSIEELGVAHNPEPRMIF